MLKKYILLGFIFFITVSEVLAIEEIEPIFEPAVITLEQRLSNPEFNNKEIFEELFLASNKFAQSNIKAANDDFKTIIETIKPNDFAYIMLSNKLAEFGLFELSHLADKKVKDLQISVNHVMNIETFYYPKKKLIKQEEIYLAEIYSNITFNNQSKEAYEELIKKQETFKDSDYANYLLALSSYKTGNNEQALKHLETAIIQNPVNVNYKLLYAEILSNGKKPEQAVKVIKEIKKQNYTTAEINRKINSAEQFVLYKKAKQTWKKDYHLAYYYYYQGEYSKAIKNLQLGIGKNKIINAKLQGLMSKVYIKTKEYDKAEENAFKAYKMIKNDVDILISLGDLSVQRGDYKKALKYYKKAVKKENNAYQATIKLANTYNKLGNKQKADELYNKILKEYPQAYEAYYQKALLAEDNNNKSVYLKKTLAINLFCSDGWFELANLEIEAKNYEMAKQYLFNAHFINPSDSRYEKYILKLQETNEK